MAFTVGSKPVPLKQWLFCIQKSETRKTDLHRVVYVTINKRSFECFVCLDLVLYTVYEQNAERNKHGNF